MPTPLQQLGSEQIWGDCGILRQRRCFWTAHAQGESPVTNFATLGISFARVPACPSVLIEVPDIARSPGASAVVPLYRVSTPRAHCPEGRCIRSLVCLQNGQILRRGVDKLRLSMPDDNGQLESSCETPSQSLWVPVFAASPGSKPTKDRTYRNPRCVFGRRGTGFSQLVLQTNITTWRLRACAKVHCMNEGYHHQTQK